MRRFEGTRDSTDRGETIDAGRQREVQGRDGRDEPTASGCGAKASLPAAGCHTVEKTMNDIHKLQYMYIVHVPCFVSRSFFGTIDVKKKKKEKQLICIFALYYLK